jgi:hypothetical protein
VIHVGVSHVVICHFDKSHFILGFKSCLKNSQNFLLVQLIHSMEQIFRFYMILLLFKCQAVILVIVLKSCLWCVNWKEHEMILSGFVLTWKYKCIVTKAVCCSDHTHCCPNGYTCDVSAGTCNRGNDVVAWLTKQPAKTVGEVKCDDSSSCPDGNTCCKLASGEYGCCPLPKVWSIRNVQFNNQIKIDTALDSLKLLNSLL